MTELFGRQASVTIEPGPLSGRTEAIKIEGLRIAFEVYKTARSETNKARVDIYNLAKSTRDGIYGNKSMEVMRLSAGYKSDRDAGIVEEIYVGEIIHAESGRSGADFVTTIECGDGDETFSTQSVEQKFGPGTRVRDVIKLVAGAFTKPTPAVDETVVFGPTPKKPKNPPTPSRIEFRAIDADLAALEVDLQTAGFSLVLRRAFSVAGNAQEVMDKLARMWRFDWSVQDGVFQITSYGRALVGESVSLTPKTGLIGSPAKTEDGVRFASLLIPQLRPGVEVHVESETVTGAFRADTVRFLGDTHGENWTAEVEAREMAQV